jgi:hypothetical protein
LVDIGIVDRPDVKSLIYYEDLVICCFRNWTTKGINTWRSGGILYRSG